MQRPLIHALAVFALMMAAPAVAEDRARLDVKVEVEAPTGQVMIALYDSEAAFDAGGQPVRAVMVDVASGARSVSLEGLKPGTYAFKAFHDVNGNGRMDTNPFGMPIEPFAFSNNAVGNMGPAKWDRAHFDISGTTAQSVTLT